MSDKTSLFNIHFGNVTVYLLKYCTQSFVLLHYMLEGNVLLFPPLCLFSLLFDQVLKHEVKLHIKPPNKVVPTGSTLGIFIREMLVTLDNLEIFY